MAAYTNHIGHHSRDTFRGKDTSISTVGKLAAAEKHNNHEYTQADIDRMQSDINLDLRHLNRHYVMVEGELREVEGRLELCDNVRKIYEDEFAAEVSAYNQRQVAGGHSERQIFDYLQKISEDKQQEVAVEGLIQIGSYEEEWSKLSMESKLRMVPILLKMLEETIKELNKDVNGEKRRFVLAGASLHLDEGSPHIHYIGVPIVETQKVTKGMKKRVKKSGVFTKDSLGTGLQDNVRATIAPMVRSAFGWELDTKKTGRNEDRNKNIQVNEMLKEQISENEKKLTSLEARIEAAKASETAAREKASKAQKNASEAERRAYEAERRAYEAECNLSVLEERVELIQDYEEYTQKADEIEQRASRIDRLLDLIQNAIRFFKEKEAREFIRECRKEISELFDWIKRAFGLVKEFEKAAEMPEEQRRSPSLDEKIKSAAARAGAQDPKGEREIQRD